MSSKRPSRLRRLGMAAQNALEIVRFGRLSRESYSAPYDVVYETNDYKLRHYQSGQDQSGQGQREDRIPILLVPPLMVASEVYDMAPDVSAVQALIDRHVDVWIIDFGAPERQTGGMERTLDDHVRGIDEAIERVRDATGRDVHLAGYSQGGMFVYQVAAYRQNRGIASLITFGSPVNIHRSLPRVDDEITDQLIAGLRTMIAVPLSRLEGLPSAVTSTGFKMMSLRKEAQQIVDFVGKLHDRQALLKRESRRVFLGGEGFVAWPGPAFRKFVDDIVVHNRMLAGGIVIDGRTIALADITCPILYFIGQRDEMARPAAVRAIEQAAPHADCYPVEIKGGHFGIVVGSTSLKITWPTVVDWLNWHEGTGPRPAHLPVESSAVSDDRSAEPRDRVPFDVELMYDVVTDAGRTLWNRLGDAVKEIGATARDVRVQYPFLSRLRAIAGDTEISPGRLLAEQAQAIPDKTFFLWRSRAFSYEDANRRIDNVVRGLIACDVKPGQRVGVLMASRPSFLSAVTALNRLGAVAVLMSPDSDVPTLSRAIAIASVSALISDPEHAIRGRYAFTRPVLVLGGGGRARMALQERLQQSPEREPCRAADKRADANVLGDIIDMETIDPKNVELPSWYRPNPGLARDLGMVIFSSGRSGEPRPSYITNWRWAFSAIGAAAACTLTPRDTVYCCLPLHHAAGSMVAAGSALVGGSRLALATPFQPDAFWTQVRRYGGTVVFYAGEMCRALVDAAPTDADAYHPVRLFAGSGMRMDVWRRLQQRFGGVGVLEFYASTEGNAVLANASGEKIGAIGQPIPASARLALASYDFASQAFVRDLSGRVRRCANDEPGVLLAQIDEHHPSSHIAEGAREGRIIRSLFEDDDSWFSTGAVCSRDRDGDYWFLDRLKEIVMVKGVPVFTRAVEDALYTLDAVSMVVAYGALLPGIDAPVLVATVVTRDGDPLACNLLDQLAAGSLDSRMRPLFIRCVDAVVTTDGYRPVKSVLRKRSITADDVGVLYYDREREQYRPMDSTAFEHVVDRLPLT